MAAQAGPSPGDRRGSTLIDDEEDGWGNPLGQRPGLSPESGDGQGSHGGGEACSRKGGLSHSLRHLALHADETRPHKPDLARGHVPAHAPRQARHLGAEDLDEVTALEGHLFRP